ncbi:MAG TPA: hypothetical protein PKM41_11665 [Deltaproteobacteria bacterium]|nr:hypothetical protein [Deltaproteobacteria bacterium]HOI07773.1 hypothetical protein [Deltaproteobacteria bacterium]
MSIHSGSRSLGSGSTSVEITTTLYELMEVMGEGIASLIEGRRQKPGRSGHKRPDPVQDRMIARRIAGMFMSGRIKFKRPRDVRKTYPEWFA